MRVVEKEDVGVRGHISWFVRIEQLKQAALSAQVGGASGEKERGGCCKP